MDRPNRLLLVLVALLLFGMGVGGLLAGFGAVRDIPSDAPVLPPQAVARWTAWDPWSTAALGLAALVTAWLGWLLVRAELRSEARTAIPDLEIPVGGDASGRGVTRLRAAAVAHALEGALERVTGVERTRVGLFGKPGRPELRARLDVAARADLAVVRESVRSELERLVATTGVPLGAPDLAIRLITSRSRRVS